MNYYNEIKDILINNEITKRAKDYSRNKSDLESYFKVGKMIVEAQGGEERAKYGDGLIRKFSKRLTKELNKGYSYRSLNLMRKFYLFQKVQPVAAQLSWSHYIELLSIKDINEINYYIDISLNQNLSRNKLREKIKSKEYQRLDNKTKNKLINNEELNVYDNIKNPIYVNTYNSNINKEDIQEKALKAFILRDIENFLEQLGHGFYFRKSEYKIIIGNQPNYIDLLLFNSVYNCHVVVELKVTESKKDHLGQIQVYMNYIDKHIKNNNQNKTIGIIVCKKDNKYLIEYSSDERIRITTYELV